MSEHAAEEPQKPKNKGGRPVGSVSRNLQVVDAIIRAYGSTDSFWDKIAEASIGGDQASTNILVARLSPPLKSRSSTIHLNINGTTAAEFSGGVLKAVSDGELPPDEASALLNAVLAGRQIEKLETLEQKVNQLMEARDNGEH